MGVLESIKSALSAIVSNKLRSFLTMLGIIIGISSVITITTIGNSIQKTLTRTFNDLGGTNFYAYMMWGMGSFSGVSMRQIPYFIGLVIVSKNLKVLLGNLDNFLKLLRVQRPRGMVV